MIQSIKHLLDISFNRVPNGPRGNGRQAARGPLGTRSNELLALLLAVSINCAAPGADRVVLLDGTSKTAEVNSITADGQVAGEGLSESLALDQLRSIERQGRTAQPADAPIIIELIGDARVRAQDITISDEMCHIQLSPGSSISIPIDMVRAIRFRPGDKVPRFERRLANRGGNDRLFVRIDDQLQSVAGLVESLTNDEAVFDLDGETVKFARDKLHGIVLASLGGNPLKNWPLTVDLPDGSSLHGTNATLEDGTLQLHISGASQVSFAWESVIGVRVRSDRLAFLSDLDPTDEQQYAIVTSNQPWQCDLSVARQPLTLKYNDGRDSREFAKGLGTHSYCQLTYETAKAYNTFAAIIGIDSATNGHGDCEFVVMGDGQELYRQRVRGSDEPRDLNIDITGIARVTLVVEPGVDLDLADHANWCDARFIRTDSN